MLKFIERDSIKIALICVILCLAVVTDARKAAGAKRGGGGSKYGSSSRVSKPSSQSQQPSYANPNIAQLSYSPGQQSAPVRPSAPVDSSSGNKPIGWNVGHESPAVAANKPPVNSAPYPVSNNQYPQAPPPSYSQYPSQHGNINGPPPPYSQHPQPGVQSRFNEAPPPYSPQQVNPGYPVQPGLGQPGFGQPGFGHAAQQPQGGYPMQPGFVPGAGQPPTIVNNYHQVPQGGSGGGGLSGLQTALLAGTGGLALYGALKPSDTKTIVINNTVVQEVPVNATEMTNGTSTVETTPVPLATYPQTGAPPSSEMIPLAPYPSTGLYPSLPTTMQECTGPECPTHTTTTIQDVPPQTTISELTSNPVPNQSPSSLAPLTTFAAMANDAATNNISPPATNPTIASSPSTTPITSPSQLPPLTDEIEKASALNSQKAKEEQSKRDNGSNNIKTSLLTIFTLPCIWILMN